MTSWDPRAPRSRAASALRLRRRALPLEPASWTTTHEDRVSVFPRRTVRGVRWNWHVQARNNEIVEHGEGYVRRIAAVEAAKRHHPVL